jgi:hypothetical protein
MDNEADVWHALHVLQGLPIIEVVKVLKTLSNEILVRLLTSSLKIGHLWAVHIFIKMGLTRAKEIFLECKLPLKEMLILADAMNRENSERCAEFFPLVPDKNLPNRELLYACILNMPVAAAVEFLAQNDDILGEMVKLIPSFVRTFPTEKVCKICWEILSNNKLSAYKRDCSHVVIRDIIISREFAFCKHIFRVVVERAGVSNDAVAKLIFDGIKRYPRATRHKIIFGDDLDVADRTLVSEILHFWPSKQSSDIAELVRELGISAD